MTIQTGDTYANAIMNAIESTVGVSAKLQIRTGAQPANCAAASSGTLLCEITVPSDWMNAAASRAVTKLGTWSGTASATGTAAHFRLFDNAGSVCHMQGSVTITGGGGDMQLDNTSIANGQTVTINTATFTAGNP